MIPCSQKKVGVKKWQLPIQFMIKIYDQDKTCFGIGITQIPEQRLNLWFTMVKKPPGILYLHHAKNANFTGHSPSIRFSTTKVFCESHFLAWHSHTNNFAPLFCGHCWMLCWQMMESTTISQAQKRAQISASSNLHTTCSVFNKIFIRFSVIQQHHPTHISWDSEGQTKNMESTASQSCSILWNSCCACS